MVTVYRTFLVSRLLSGVTLGCVCYEVKRFAGAGSIVGGSNIASSA